MTATASQVRQAQVRRATVGEMIGMLIAAACVLPLIVIAAGPPRVGQQRPSALLSDYLENDLPDPSRQGQARTPNPRLQGCARPASNPDCNDLLAF